MDTSQTTVQVGHSPDPDDAFMFYGIASGKVDTAGLEIGQVLEDIESLNRRAMAGELEVSAVSIHAFAHLSDRYALMSCGASMGDGYGPRIVSREPLDREALKSVEIAVPGTLTSAFLTLQLYLDQKEVKHRVVDFDKIIDVVKAGEVDAGLIIHEGQLTYKSHGLHLCEDLGVWFGEQTGGLPLPLGGNAVRRNLGAPMMSTLTRILRDSIRFGLENREEALKYAIDFGRGLDEGLNDEFVGMYVNELTLDYGERGKKAIETFLTMGRERGLVPAGGPVEFID